MTQNVNTEDLIQRLSEMQIIKGKKRNLYVGNEHLLSLMPSPV